MLCYNLSLSQKNDKFDKPVEADDFKMRNSIHNYKNVIYARPSNDESAVQYRALSAILMNMLRS